MTTQQDPRIDLSLCTGCRICVESCPTGALAQADEKATLAYPELCTWCTVCEEICPEHAIALPFLIMFAPAQGRWTAKV